MELVDTSVWARQAHSRIRQWWEEQMLAGEIAICDQIKLELLHSARNRADFDAKRASLDVLPNLAMRHRDWERVLDVYQRLAAIRPQWQRSVKHADLIIAACAEAGGVTLVHYDADYDAISAVTGQPARWVAPRGSL